MTPEQVRGDEPNPIANPMRGEAAIRIAGEVHKLRPSFTALVAAEEEIGPLFAFADRAASGGLKLGEIAALLWHCIAEPDRPPREAVGAAVVEQGLAATAAPLRALLTEILKGAG